MRAGRGGKLTVVGAVGAVVGVVGPVAFPFAVVPLRPKGVPCRLASRQAGPEGLVVISLVLLTLVLCSLSWRPRLAAGRGRLAGWLAGLKDLVAMTLVLSFSLDWRPRLAAGRGRLAGWLAGLEELVAVTLVLCFLGWRPMLSPAYPPLLVRTDRGRWKSSPTDPMVCWVLALVVGGMVGGTEGGEEDERRDRRTLSP